MKAEENKQPQLEKRKRGFYYSVTDAQIREHRKRSIEEIFEWLETTNEFIYNLQTPAERERMNKIRRGVY